MVRDKYMDRQVCCISYEQLRDYIPTHWRRQAYGGPSSRLAARAILQARWDSILNTVKYLNKFIFENKFLKQVLTVYFMSGAWWVKLSC